MKQALIKSLEAKLRTMSLKDAAKYMQQYNAFSTMSRLDIATLIVNTIGV